MTPVERPSSWLFSRRTDFWLACGGASIALLAPLLLITLRGDRELLALDFVLSELHLGATYGTIVRRRLWRDRSIGVLGVPAVILVATYVLSTGGHALALTTVAMYAAVWHRGRQSLGVARFYQRALGGPASRAHQILFRGAIYAPMAAAALVYTHLAPTDYEGDPYVGLDLGAGLASAAGLVALVWVIAYLAWTLDRGDEQGASVTAAGAVGRVHPGEWWVVVAHAVAFGSAYVLGAANVSFMLVLAVHHEVQYLAFTYAMARREGVRGIGPLSYLLWPGLGLAGAVAGGWLELSWLAPLGIGGLFCHYWLDGRIWTRPATSR
jgi:hypothetical protein